MGFNKAAVSIYRQLKNFGLDGREWLIWNAKESATIHLKHRNDPGFQLKGVVRRSPGGEVLLHSLAIMSI